MIFQTILRYNIFVVLSIQLFFTADGHNFNNWEVSPLDYNEVANKQKKIASVMSVKINEDGSCGEICLEAPNDLYLASVNVKREDFVPLVFVLYFMVLDRESDFQTVRKDLESGDSPWLRSHKGVPLLERIAVVRFVTHPPTELVNRARPVMVRD